MGRYKPSSFCWCFSGWWTAMRSCGAFQPTIAYFWGQQQPESKVFVRQRDGEFVSHLPRAGAASILFDKRTSGDDLPPLRPKFVERPENNEDDDPASFLKQKKVLVVMDGFCSYHSQYLIQSAQENTGARVVEILSDYLRNYLLLTQPELTEQWQSMRMPTTPEQALEWSRHLGGCLDEKVAAVYCESDSGLEDAERLRDLLNVKCRDNPVILPARRDKFLMNERIKEHGQVAVVQQQLCSTAKEACEFAETLLSQPPSPSLRFARSPRSRVVVKPRRGVASESVYLCSDAHEVQDAFDKITSTSVFGSTTGASHEQVLVQECLEGTEYAIDVVSRNGHHKVAAIWRYDKRPANGAPFCYFQTKLTDATLEPDVVPQILDYIRKTLNVLGIRYGFTHNEVIFTADRGPVLVEVNCRQHNMDFAPLAMACIGYNALDMTVEALVGDDVDDDDDEGLWHMFPDEPLLQQHGCMVHLVNYARGLLEKVNYLDEMSELPSFFQGQVYERFLECNHDEPIQPTIDIRSDAGWCQLIHPDEEQLESDYQQIVSWMPSMFQVF